jgi:Mrp family chromosome partitioning ATPase/capsular polysaccharide biosynthesis protein
MLHTSLTAKIGGRDRTGHGEGSAGGFDWRWMIGAVAYHRNAVIGLTLAFVLLAILHIVFRSPTYTATTALQLTNLRLSPDNASVAETQPDPTFIETQVQILGSQRIALDVASALKLISPEDPPIEKLKVLTGLQRGLDLDRVGLSNIVRLSFSSSNAEEAARVANEFVNAYVADQNAARVEAAQSAGSGWLHEKLRWVGPRARVLAKAFPPQYKNNFPGRIIVLGAGFVGMLLGIATALLLGSVDRQIRTPEQATAATGVPCFGIIPDIRKQVYQATQSPSEECGHAGSFDVANPVLSAALENPFSSFTLRHVKASCDECFSGKGLRYLGVTSTFPGEGRSIVASSLALGLAASGRRVLLVDCDTFDAKLSGMYAGSSRFGLTDFLEADTPTLSTCVLVEPRTGLHFLPIGKDQAGGAALWSEAMKRLFDQTASAYDYVIFDTPPLATAEDIRSSARFIEGFLLVISWGAVTIENLEVGLDAAGSVRDRLLGTVLNRVNVAQARLMFSDQIKFAEMRTNLIRKLRTKPLSQPLKTR